MLQDILDEHNIKIFYAMGELPAKDGVIEFGWLNADSISLDQDIVISHVLMNEAGDIMPTGSSAVTLKDYRTYLNRLNSLTPDEFIQKWEYSLDDLDSYWVSRYPSAEPDQGQFVMNLSRLVRDGDSFEMYNVRFEVVRFNG